MNTRLIIAIADVLVRPSTCFANVSDNPKYYFVSSVAIFVIAGTSAFLSSMLNASYWDPHGQNHLNFSAASLLPPIANTVLQNIVLITSIFWVGRKLGGTSCLKKTFSVLSYCLVPVTIGAVLIPVGMMFVSQMSFTDATGVYLGGGSMDADPDLSPSYALDFASSAIISYGFIIPFAVWILVLFLKATKIVHEFNMKKSIITLVSAIALMYLGNVAFGMSSILLSSF